MTLHEDDRETFDRCKVIACETAELFKLDLKVFEPKRRPHPGCTEGLCYYEEHRISVVFRFRLKAKWFSTPLALKEILDTVGHELAHLRYPGHGKEFKDLANRIISYIMETYYNPYTTGFKLALVD